MLSLDHHLAHGPKPTRNKTKRLANALFSQRQGSNHTVWLIPKLFFLVLYLIEILCKPITDDKAVSGSSSGSSARQPLGQNNNNLASTTTVTRSRFTKSKNFARNLLNEIEAAPNNAARKRNREMPDSHRYQPAFKQSRHHESIVYVTKWIDYYEQIGLGYKLSDATVNILLRNGDTGEPLFQLIRSYYFGDCQYES